MAQKSSIAFTLQAKTAYIIIAALSAVLYMNTANHGFALDDTAVIENNRFVKDGFAGIPQLLSTFYWEGYWEANAGLYRPASMIMFAMEYQLSPNNPAIHHLMNILLYVISCCLLFRFLSRFFNGINPYLFLFATLLFVVNPLHTEVVANIKSRDEILALLFFLLCCQQLYFQPEEKKTRSLVLSGFFILLALLSKEGAVIFIPIIFLFDYVREKNIKTLLVKRVHLIAVTALWLAWHQYVIKSSPFPVIEYTRNDNSLIGASFIEQKATALGMFARYILKLVYPYELSYDYSFNQIPIINLFSPLALLGLVLLALLIFLAIRYFKKDLLITISIAFILLPLLMTGNLLFNIGATMADRFLFIPSIGASLLIVYFIFKILKTDVLKNFSPQRAAYILVPILLVFSVKTFTRNRDWKGNDALFTKDVNTVPASARAHYNYGTALMYKKNKSVADEIAARKEYETCLRIDPTYTDACINLGASYASEKLYDKAIAIYKQGLLLSPHNSTLYGNIGDAYFKNKQGDSAIVYLEKAQQLGNKIPDLFNLLGTALFQKQEYDRSITAFEKGIALDSTSWNMYLNYGSALAVSNKKEEALKAFQRSYSLNSSNAQTLYFIALAYRDMGDTLNANKYYDQFMRTQKP